MCRLTTIPLLIVLCLAVLSQQVLAADTTSAQKEDAADLAQDLTNPLADLITVPVQMNLDRKLGPADDGTKLTVNVQPVIPFSLSQDWNLITRTIVPIISQEDIFPGAGSQSGFGDVNMSLFFSPKKPSENGIIWGAGPVLLMPTASESLLGAKKWGAGPTAVALAFRGPWTMGLLGNHLWSYAGDSDRPDISNTFLQPFITHTWPSAWTVSVQSESSYNWKTEKWSVPANLSVSKLVWLGKLPVSLQAGVGYWLESPPGGAEGIRYRLAISFVLPKL